MAKLLFDSWAWLELFSRSPAGAKISEMAEKAEAVYTTTANLYEVLYRIEKDAGIAKAEERKKFVEAHCIILDITKEIVLKALEARREQKLSSIDSFTFAAAILQGADLVTGDPDFKGLKNVVYLGALKQA